MRLNFSYESRYFYWIKLSDSNPLGDLSEGLPRQWKKDK